MKMLTAEITNLLDKLYNLRGEDSVILTKMASEKEVASETKERTTNEKAELQEKIANLTEELELLASEGKKLVEVLSQINPEDFKTVLDKLHINFNPSKISEEVNSLLPETIEKVEEEQRVAKEKLVNVEAEMNEAIATIEELAIRRDEALANQTRLNEYFDLALNGNINITRDSITSLLEKFDFTEDESREAAKILMFPEDALYEYEEKLKNAEQSGKSISEVFQEAKEGIDEKVEENEPASPRDELINLLTELGFDYLDFTSNDLEKILANYNQATLRKNVEFAKSNGLKLDLFVENVALLYDKEFESKVNKLMEIGKDAFDVYLNPDVLVKHNKKSLDNVIDTFKNSGLDPKIVPLMAY